MNVDELMCQLKEKDVLLSAEDGMLHFDTPSGAISEETAGIGGTSNC